MTDIVKRLDQCWNSIDPKAREAALDAAMAIRALRGDLFIAREEIERLRAERDALKAALKEEARRAALEEAADEIEKLRVERDALLNKLSKRDALHTQDLLEIQAWRKANPNSTPWPQKERLVSWLLDEMTALRAALGEKE